MTERKFTAIEVIQTMQEIGRSVLPGPRSGIITTVKPSGSVSMNPCGEIGLNLPAPSQPTVRLMGEPGVGFWNGWAHPKFYFPEDKCSFDWPEEESMSQEQSLKPKRSKEEWARIRAIPYDPYIEWKDRDGNVKPFAELADTHLVNIVNKMRTGWRGWLENKEQAAIVLGRLEAQIKDRGLVVDQEWLPGLELEGEETYLDA